MSIRKKSSQYKASKSVILFICNLNETQIAFMKTNLLKIPSEKNSLVSYEFFFIRFEIFDVCVLEVSEDDVT